MGWTHFTALLVEGDFITTDQRNELYDAFLERAEAVTPWLSTTYSAGSSLRTGGFATDLVERSGGLTSRLIDAVQAISNHYARPEIIEGSMTLDDADPVTFYGTTADPTNLINLACTEVGIDPADFDDILANPTYDCFQRWNVIREAIRLLKYPRIEKSGTAHKYRTGVDATWPDARDAFLAFTETSSGPPFGTPEIYLRAGLSANYEIEAYLSYFYVTIPAVDAFSDGYQLHGLLSRDLADNVGSSVHVDFDGSSSDPIGFASDTDRTIKPLGTSGRTSTGSVAVNLSMTGYDDSASLDDYEPTLVDPDRVGAALMWDVIAEPTFSFD